MASGAVLDLTEEDGEQKRKKGSMVWDKKSKKYVRVQDDKKRVKTESGVYIAATYKTNRYAKWKERSKLVQQTEEHEDESSKGQGDRKRHAGPLLSSHPAMKKARNAVPAHKKGPRSEIQRPEQIMKKRALEEKKALRKQKGGGKGKGKGRKGR